MKSTISKRSIIIAGRRTSVSLEDAFWNALREIAVGRGATLSDLVASIDVARERPNLSSAIRLFVLGVYRDQIPAPRRCTVRQLVEGLQPPALSPSRTGELHSSAPGEYQELETYYRKQATFFQKHKRRTSGSGAPYPRTVRRGTPGANAIGISAPGQNAQLARLQGRVAIPAPAGHFVDG